MKLTDKKVKISDIMIDPFNPRNLDEQYDSQANMLNKILGKCETGELLLSMQKNIKWVNRIVIRKIDLLPENVRSRIYDSDEYKYIVVEGNTRLACLKSNKIIGYDENTDIPVLIAEKENNETYEQFELEIMTTQAIANIMIVKDWEEIPKAKRIYEIYTAKKEDEPSGKMSEIVKDISNCTGINNRNVKKMITRYCIYKELKEQHCAIEEKYWGYLEVFEINNDNKEFIGLMPKTLEFEWNCDESENEDVFEKQEIFRSIPKMFKKAEEQVSNSKEFRNAFTNMLKSEKNFCDRKDIAEGILDGIYNWKMFLNKNINIDNTKQQWKNKLKCIYKDIDIFPIGSDWAIALKADLKKISDKINKHLNSLNE